MLQTKPTKDIILTPLQFISFKVTVVSGTLQTQTVASKTNIVEH